MRLALPVCLLLLACRSDRPADRPLPAADEPGLPTLHAAPRRPLAVRWVPKGREAGRLALTARFHFGSALQQPLHVTVTVPPGLRLLSGEKDFELPPPASPGPVDKDYLFAVDAPPSQALLIEAAVQSESAGLTARDSFSFEAPASGPKERESAPRERAPVEVNGSKLGTPRALP